MGSKMLIHLSPTFVYDSSVRGFQDFVSPWPTMRFEGWVSGIRDIFYYSSNWVRRWMSEFQDDISPFSDNCVWRVTMWVINSSFHLSTTIVYDGQVSMFEGVVLPFSTIIRCSAPWIIQREDRTAVTVQGIFTFNIA